MAFLLACSLTFLDFIHSSPRIHVLDPLCTSTPIFIHICIESAMLHLVPSSISASSAFLYHRARCPLHPLPRHAHRMPCGRTMTQSIPFFILSVVSSRTMSLSILCPSFRVWDLDTPPPALRACILGQSTYF
ncbi:hypothetical protein SISSUDRAFT_58555 [Sistotremastrum suecicum HHB10207 ss-3]|uniref:Uncharacterized protein n=1 Tax=Sistotremastrum suecicum HHB10207 ss-3 TaxID=1314776 RepID=A0A166BN69_9AGAM|nr:hypothetical protein SISSUDRAFT_58555 [Sistotremastrum suecicum HHB10207 ss-3]